jgi:hypothetical protein
MDLTYQIYKDRRTVFRFKDVAIMMREDDPVSLNKRLNYLVRIGKLLNPRKGIYCKHGYNTAELACRIFTPAYISLGYVLQRAGVVFQYDSRITMLSYLSREIEVERQTISFRKIKNPVLIETQGIERREDNVNIATPERAFLDMIYLNGSMYFDNLRPVNEEKVEQILPIYRSKIIEKIAKKLLKEDGYK